jgi:hypothetical protein
MLRVSGRAKKISPRQCVCGSQQKKFSLQQCVCLAPLLAGAALVVGERVKLKANGVARNPKMSQT